MGDNFEYEQTPVLEQYYNDPVEQDNAVQRPGRKLGDTKEVLRERHQSSRKENETQLIAEGVRRSERLKNINNQANVTITENQVPTKYEEVGLSSFKNEWHDAMVEEINYLRSHEVWKLIPREPNMKVIKSKWIYSLKRNPDSTIDKRKARLVAADYNTRENLIRKTLILLS